MSLHRKTGFQNLFAQAFSALAASFGLIALLGWILELPLLSSFGMRLIPMAPSTALLFILMGVLSFFQASGAKNRAVNRIERLIGCLVAFISLALLILSSQGIYTDVEHLGLQIDGKLDNTPIGHMSPVTAFSFLLVSLTFLILLSASPAAHRQALAAWGLAGFIILTNYVFVLAYFLGLPLLYGINTIPPALPTSLAFLSLGIALQANASTQENTQETGVSTPVPYTIRLVFTILALSIVTSGYLYYQNYEQQFRTQAEHQLSAIAGSKVSSLVSWRNERLADANVLYRNPAFTEQVKYYLENPADLQAQKQLQAWLDKFQTNFKYKRVSLLDTHGLERVSAPAPTAPTNVYLVEHAAVALSSGQVTFADFHRDTSHDPIHLAMLVPIFSEQEDGHPLGVLFFLIDPDIYLYPFLQQWPIPSLSAETLLIRREEDAALFLNPLRFQPDAALNLRIPLTDTDRLAVKAALGQTGIIEGRNYSGDAVFGALAPVPDTPWFLVAHMDMAEINAALRERLWETSLFFGGLLAASGAGLLLFWRQQRMRYYQAQIETLNALHESQAQVANVFRSAMDAIITVDEDQKIIIFNPSAEQMFGCPADEIIGQTMDRFLPEYAHKLHRKHMYFFGQSDSTKRGMKTPMLALTCLRANGEAFASDISISHLEIGGRKLYTAIIRDSTERKQMEDELRQSQENFARAFISSPTALAITRLADGKFFSVNEAYTQVMGYKPAEILGRTPAELKIYVNQTERDGLVQQLGENGGVRDYELLVKTKSGEARNLLVSMEPILYNKEASIISTFIDITERKLATQKLAEYSTQLEEMVEQRTRELSDAQEQLVRQERLAALGQLAGSLGHELRNPLGVISNAVYFLKVSQSEASPKVWEYLDIIEKETRVSDKIITDLLDFTRIKSLDRQPASVSELIDQTLERNPPPPAVKVQLEIPAGLRLVFADPQHVVQILGNLVLNAYQAMLAAKPARTEKNLKVSVTEQHGMIKIIVTDTGPGIPPENLVKIFQPLFTTKTKGIGLGLAVSQKLVEANGGKIGVESAVGKGSKFSVYLPVYSVATSGSEAVSA